MRISDWSSDVCSSDLRAAHIPARMASVYALRVAPQDFHAVAEVYLDGDWHMVDATGMTRPAERSEEHTSELQSLMRISYAVFCLKKKNKKKQTIPICYNLVRHSNLSILVIHREKNN